MGVGKKVFSFTRILKKRGAGRSEQGVGSSKMGDPKAETLKTENGAVYIFAGKALQTLHC